MKFLSGKVISLKMNKTVIVLVKSVYKIPVYNKLINIFKKYYVHDEFNFCSKNDFIYFISCNPISKKKFWKVFKIF
ncbi:MAG: 30S ribosomal protein S17 [Candidatus Nasuia deltocephalinicola]